MSVVKHRSRRRFKPGGWKEPYFEAGRPGAGPWNKAVPLDGDSVWAGGSRYHTDSSAMITYLLSLHGPTGTYGKLLTCDPTQYTYPVYYADSEDASFTVVMDGYGPYTASSADTGYRQSSGTVWSVNGDHGWLNAEGSDGQMIIVNRQTGEETGFWQISISGRHWDPEQQGSEWPEYEAHLGPPSWPVDQRHAANGGRYNVKWSGVGPPKTETQEAFGQRGAGMPYQAGLVREWEIRRGWIGHALAFTCHGPWHDGPEGVENDTDLFVYPARKTDAFKGVDTDGSGIPEGARIVLDPSVDVVADYNWSSRPAAERRAGQIMAKALQVYGAILVDNGGSMKVCVESSESAAWNGAIVRETLNPVDQSDFRVIDWNKWTG